MIKHINENMITFGQYTIERGARERKGIATKELMSDEVTASHYQFGKYDRYGKVIVEGEEITYLDWNEFIAGGGLWYVYKSEDGVDKKVGEFETQAEAVAAVAGGAL